VPTHQWQRKNEKKEDTHTSAIALQFTEQYGPVGVGPARVARYLERQGLLKHDTGDSYLTAQAVDAPDDDPPASSARRATPGRVLL
jgi:hypothetical protein